MTRDARRVADGVARDSHGRLIALMARRTGDIAAAEDALSDAFAAALRRWPIDGIPDKPEAWLLTAARRAHGKAARAAATRDRRAADLNVIDADLRSVEASDFPDERLKLLFVCAHPAIDPAIRAPLMLQTVLGLDAARVATPFLVAPKTMGQRLVRAKVKIRDAGIRFEIPDPSDFPSRLEDVLNAVYAGFGAGMEIPDQDRGGDLAEEAIYLGRLLVDLLPRDPEAKGLLALMLHCEARRQARRDASGAYVPLSEQDVACWSMPMIQEAETLLSKASESATFGRFQCEAAIQSVHAHRARVGQTNWPAIVHLYDLLLERAPSVGASVGRAAALCQAARPEDALDGLDMAWTPAVDGYQPYWATRGEALLRLGRRDEARAALGVAIALSGDPAISAFLEQRLERV